jgi:hypothetical protein
VNPSLSNILLTVFIFSIRHSFQPHQRSDPCGTTASSLMLVSQTIKRFTESCRTHQETLESTAIGNAQNSTSIISTSQTPRFETTLRGKARGEGLSRAGLESTRTMHDLWDAISTKSLELRGMERTYYSLFGSKYSRSGLCQTYSREKGLWWASWWITGRFDSAACTSPSWHHQLYDQWQNENIKSLVYIRWKNKDNNILFHRHFLCIRLCLTI